jgi:adenosylcobinamide-GDP ribazoletransferase
MRGLRQELRLFAVALQFLTRVPVRLQRWDPRWLTDCVRYFPLVGAWVGAASGLALWGASQLWSPGIAALVALATSTLITGAFHEDGLADSFDALGGAVSRERALEIMKDSRIGSYGSMALLLATGLRWAALAALAAQNPALAACALVAVHALARCTSVAVMVALPYAGDAEHAKAKPLAQQVPKHQLLWALAWCLPLLAFAPWALFPVAAAVALLMSLWLRRRLGGYTGDTLGATEQVAEAALLLALAA